MKTTRLWQALDQFTGAAAPEREWVEHLGDQWAAAAPLLRPSGRVAEELVCPKSSEAGCTVRVVRLLDGRLRAECGDTPRRCNHLVLAKNEVAILQIDRSKLARVLIRAFALREAPASVQRDGILRLGRYEISAGRGFPVFLAIPQPSVSEPVSSFDPITSIPGPKLLLMPTAESFDAGVWSYLQARGVFGFALDDVLIWDARLTLVPRLPAPDLFRAVIEALPGGTTNAVPQPSLALPVGTRWQDIHLEFVGPELIKITAPGTTRVVAPSDLGMSRRNSMKPTVQWVWLRTFAECGGRMPTGGPRAQKQKQIVCDKLRVFFGLAESPIEDEDRHYIARFRVSGEAARATWPVPTKFRRPLLNLPGNIFAAQATAMK